MSTHSIRAHSKFAASGSERWLNCAASVELEESSPVSVDTVWSVEGTEAHDVHEIVGKFLTNKALKFERRALQALQNSNEPMVKHALASWEEIFKLIKECADPLVLIEKRAFNDDINKEHALVGEDQMFGTVDVRIVELYGTLHIIDYKYGQGHVVNPVKNTQMIQYALAVAQEYDWQFSEVAMHIIQPRSGAASIIKSWGITIEELKEVWRPLWVKGVKRVLENKSKPFPGHWCHWCRANKPGYDGKIVCPAKRQQIQEKRNDKVINSFSKPFNERVTNGEEKSEKEIKPKSQKAGGKKVVESFDEI